MSGTEKLTEAIRQAFSIVEKPPAWCLVNSREGSEPELLEKEFAHIPEWEDLTADFLDLTPDGFGTALAFFSDEAYRYYLPAYLIASVRNHLQRVDPVFYLTHGFTENSSSELLNGLRYGTRTWYDYARYRHSVFDADQAGVISRYLTHQKSSGNRTDLEKKQVSEALDNYWRERAGGK